jgi:hypothetical protein
MREECPALAHKKHGGPKEREELSPEEFRRQVVHCARLLEQHGFRRACSLEIETSTLVDVVYAGRHVAFSFGLDRRDQMLDFRVTRVRDGRLFTNSKGGFSDGVFGFLIKNCGYRGGIQPSNDMPSGSSPTELHLSGLVNLLTLPCAARLLADTEDSLPRSRSG